MTRSGADALCKKCGGDFHWIIGTPQVCSCCRVIAIYLASKGTDKEAERVLGRLLEEGTPKQECLVFTVLDAAEYPLEETTQGKLNKFEDNRANLTLVEEHFAETREIMQQFGQ